VKPRIQDVIETIMAAVGQALAIAEVPSFGQIVAGQPIGTALVAIMGQSTEQGIISVFPRPGSARNVTRYPAGTEAYVTALNVPLTCTLTPASGSWTMTFTGSVVAGLNIHTLAGSTPADAYYQTVAEDSLTSVASSVAAKINALAGSATATASINTIVVTASPLLICNIGGSQTTARLTSRVNQTVQVSIWVQDPHATQSNVNSTTYTTPAPLRFILADAIMSAVGTAEERFLTLSDGTPLDVEYATEYIDDQPQSDYSLYAYHIAFRVEYDILRYLDSTQIGVVEATLDSTNDESITVLSGGS
jgi:hypothetical protein